tara:strand:- start:131 stop:328 length:198 start_codon:yes stop_codon:yes gene_type:complete
MIGGVTSEIAIFASCVGKDLAFTDAVTLFVAESTRFVGTFVLIRHLIKGIILLMKFTELPRKISI